MDDMAEQIMHSDKKMMDAMLNVMVTVGVIPNAALA